MNPTSHDARLADLQRQGFMRAYRKTRVTRQEKPVVIVSCERCKDWHRKGQHTAKDGAR